MDALLKLPYFNSILPVIGILLTVFVVKKFLDGSIEKGTSQIMIAVAKRSGYMPRKQMYAQILTSSLTVGMGGSAGLESPITITGQRLDPILRKISDSITKTGRYYWRVGLLRELLQLLTHPLLVYCLPLK